MTHFDPPRPIPIDPKIFVRGIEPQKCFVFKSAMCPLKLSFHYQIGEDGHKKKDSHSHGNLPPLYSVMYKHGDDVR